MHGPATACRAKETGFRPDRNKEKRPLHKCELQHAAPTLSWQHGGAEEREKERGISEMTEKGQMQNSRDKIQTIERDKD